MLYTNDAFAARFSKFRMLQFNLTTHSCYIPTKAKPYIFFDMLTKN